VVGGRRHHAARGAGIDAEYDDGRLRERRWSITGSLIYDRNGSPRFYGIGNNSTPNEQTNYTDQQELAQLQVGLNLNHAWQLQYTGRARAVDVTAGTLKGIPSIEGRFARTLGLGNNSELLHRVAIVYDTRDDLSVPSRGTKWVAYAGLASRSSIFDYSLYSEAGIDGRAFWPIATDTVLAAHTALRYLPTAHRVPFWALSSIGGDVSVIGGEPAAARFRRGTLLRSRFVFHVARAASQGVVFQCGLDPGRSGTGAVRGPGARIRPIGHLAADAAAFGRRPGDPRHRTPVRGGLCGSGLRQ